MARPVRLALLYRYLRPWNPTAPATWRQPALALHEPIAHGHDAALAVILGVWAPVAHRKQGTGQSDWVLSGLHAFFSSSPVLREMDPSIVRLKNTSRE